MKPLECAMRYDIECFSCRVHLLNDVVGWLLLLRTHVFTVFLMEKILCRHR
jgi:hypothetical protein